MKRALFITVMILAWWALIDPESLAIRLEHAGEIMPEWFKQALAGIFAGLWL